MSSTSYQVNIVLVGDAGVGKSCFIKKHQTGEFSHDYTPTLNVQSSPLPWNTTAGYLDVTVWEVPSSNELSPRSREPLKIADAAIILFDMCNKTTLDHVHYWAHELRSSTHDSLPIVVCGNKADQAERGHNSIQNTVQSEYYEISALDNLNLEEPWFYLFREIFKEPNLQSAPTFCCFPAIEIDEALAIQLQAEMERAAREPLPDDSEDDSRL